MAVLYANRNTAGGSPKATGNLPTAGVDSNRTRAQFARHPLDPPTGNDESAGVDDSEEVIRAIHMTDPQLPLDIVLHTPGGLVLAALQIARAIHAYPGKVTVFVPHYAMSGGTLIALAADEIVMSPHAVLGPVDPQLGQYPAASVLKVVEQKPVADIDDQTLILADLARKATDQVRRSVVELLKDKMDADRAEQVAAMLSQGTWTHDHPITADDAKAMGLPISTDIPESVLYLLSLYPQPMRRVPTVEYVPVPRRAPNQRDRS